MVLHHWGGPGIGKWEGEESEPEGWHCEKDGIQLTIAGFEDGKYPQAKEWGSL